MTIKAIGERVAEPKGEKKYHGRTSVKATIKQKRVLSPSSQAIIPEEEGQERKEEGMCAKNRRLQKKRV